jgi:hypothetical protein
MRASMEDVLQFQADNRAWSKASASNLKTAKANPPLKLEIHERNVLFRDAE